MLAEQQAVMVYHDPLTRKNPEGKAVLLHRELIIEPGLEYWKVTFIDTGEVTFRSIKI